MEELSQVEAVVEILKQIRTDQPEIDPDEALTIAIEEVRVHGAGVSA